ncbi:MAG: hypothetical protein AB7R40_24810 [Nitrospiraceae bacterium]
MTNQSTYHPSLDKVLDEIATAPTAPDAKTVRAWTAKYPAYTNAIVDFVTDWIEMELVPVGEPPSEEAVDAAVSRTMSRVQLLLDEADRAAPLTDLSRDIRSAGHDFASFERTVGIDRSILDCLISRLVKPATVPGRLIRDIAAALNRSVEQIRDYLRLPMQTSAAFKARRRPAARQADFGDIVRDSQLSDADKSDWLAEPPDLVMRE